MQSYLSFVAQSLQVAINRFGQLWAAYSLPQGKLLRSNSSLVPVLVVNRVNNHPQSSLSWHTQLLHRQRMMQP